MTYGTSHFLIGGGGGIFRGRVKKKYCCVRGGGGGHNMKNQNIGGCVLSTQPDQQKCAKNAKNDQTFKIFPRSFRSLGILQNSYFWCN